MKTKINNKLIRSFSSCYDPAEIRIPDNESLSVKNWILKYRNTVKEKRDVIWLICRKEFMSDRDLRLFAVWCAREALKLVKNPDERSINTCNVAERYANGQATDEELYTAWYTARAAAWDAARYTAWYTVGAAAWDAARYTAGATAGAAAWDAARAAAWATTRYAAGTTARAAAWDAARYAVGTAGAAAWDAVGTAGAAARAAAWDAQINKLLTYFV